MTERELLEAVLQQVDAYASAMPPPNNWTPQFMSLVISARQALIQIDMDANEIYLFEKQALEASVVALDRLATLETAVLTIIKAVQSYLPPDSGVSKDQFIAEVIGAVDNPAVFAALHGTSDAGNDSLKRGFGERQMTEHAKHPMQPILWVGDSIRFKENAIVAYLARERLNDIAAMPFTDEDRSQLAQLIGYSVSGFGGLDYADPEIVASADETAAAMVKALEGKK